MTSMNDRAGTATQERPSTMNGGMSPMTQAGMTTGAGVTGWGVGMAGGCIIGLIAGMFLGLAISNSARR
jgi:hypothetical protein